VWFTLKNINIILVETTHPGNIGAAARAMKTMGLESLRLVKPKIFPHADATVRAAGADDILSRAVLFDTLAEAVGDCKFVFGTSTRKRSLQCEVLGPVTAADEIRLHIENNVPVGIVFGRERTGLTNNELDLCQKMITIPTNPGFSSLNIASAVQILCYELRKNVPETDLGVADEIKESGAVEHAELNFLDPDKPRRLMRRLRQMFNRTGMDQNEYNIMRGILTAIQEKVNQK
jgi:TrmH family RNA methyltransferase